MKRFAPPFLLILLIIPLLGQEVLSDDSANRADFIMEVVNGVKWPAGSGNGPDSEFVISVFEDSLLADKLEELAQTNTELKIIVNRVTIKDDISNSQAVFIGSKELSILAKVLKMVKKKPILTFSDSEGFARYGVMIEILANGEKVEYAINKMTIKQANLEIEESIIEKAKAAFG